MLLQPVDGLAHCSYTNNNTKGNKINKVIKIIIMTFTSSNLRNHFTTLRWTNILPDK